jgi:hypothetical protein
VAGQQSNLTVQGRVRQVHAFFRERTTAQMLATAAPIDRGSEIAATCATPTGT